MNWACAKTSAPSGLRVGRQAPSGITVNPHQVNLPSNPLYTHVEEFSPRKGIQEVNVLS